MRANEPQPVFRACALACLAMLLGGCELDDANRPPAGAPVPAPVTTTTLPPSSAAPSPSVAHALVYRYGGFDGSRAKEEPRCRIGSLRVSSDALTYKWIAGGCEALGASGREDWSHTVACAFYQASDGRWIGGKFDWISTSRTSRSLENIRNGYNGWDPSAFFAATRHAFCIVSADGKTCSNLVVQE